MADKTPLLVKTDDDDDVQEMNVFWLVKDLKNAWRDGHETLCGTDWDVPYEDQWSYNPFYWLLNPILALCVATGVWAHRPFGQGDPLPNETPVEKEARVQWIFMTDGPFAIDAVYEICYICYLLASDSPLSETADPAIGLILDVAYVFGNVVFLDAMARKDGPVVRVAIVANAAFAFGLTTLLVFGLVWSGLHHHFQPVKIVNWVIRTIVVIFFVAAVALYVKLWHAYDDHQSGRQQTNIIDAVRVSIAGVAVWCLFSYACFLGGPKTIWAVVA